MSYFNNLSMQIQQVDKLWNITTCNILKSTICKIYASTILNKICNNAIGDCLDGNAKVCQLTADCVHLPLRFGPAIISEVAGTLLRRKSRREFA